MTRISAEDIRLLIEELRDESFRREYQGLRSWMEIDLLFQQAADALEKQAAELAARGGEGSSGGIGNLVTRLQEGTTGSDGVTKTDRYINSIMHEAAIVIETQASELVAIKEGSSGVFAANMSPMRSYWLQAENEQLRLDLSSERAAHERAKQLLSEEEAFRVRAISNMEAAEFDRDEYHHHAAANGRLAWELLEKLQAAEARITELEKALNEASDALDAAMEDVEHWGGYAGEYFQDKHDLDGDLARISEQATSARRALGGKNV